jgi:hypothetical protein
MAAFMSYSMHVTFIPVPCRVMYALDLGMATFSLQYKEQPKSTTLRLHKVLTEINAIKFFMI